MAQLDRRRPAVELIPEVEVGCHWCGFRGRETVCTSAAIREQHEWLCDFHRRRLHPRPSGAAPRNVLADRAEFTQGYATDVVACTSCGLLFRTPRPRAEAIKLAYERDRYGRQRLESLHESQLEFYRSKVQFLRRRLGVPRRARVVEIGSFVGGFLTAGLEVGWNVLGVDPGEEVVAFCKEKGLPVHRGTLDELPLPPGSVDCIAIWNTFDQVPRPAPMLRAAIRALRPGGLLTVRVPNGTCFRVAAIWNRRLPSLLRAPLRAAMAWNNLLAFPYLYGYSVHALDRLLGRHGMRRIAVKGDVLPSLADTETRPSAKWEERILKAIWRLACAAERACGVDTVNIAPWFDAYFVSTRLHRIRRESA